MLFDCPSTSLAVPREIMRHVVRVESSGNPYAIGVVRGRLVRQPRKLDEAVATARMLEERGFNFSLGLAQVNRYNLRKYELSSYEKAFDPCANLAAGSRILKECFDRSQDWGKAFSCYYSGNFTTGFKHGYVQKVVASMRTSVAAPANAASSLSIPVVPQVPKASPRLPQDVSSPRAADRRLTLEGVSRTGGGVAVPIQSEARNAAPAQPFVPAAAQQAIPASGASAPPAAPVPVRDSGFVF